MAEITREMLENSSLKNQMLEKGMLERLVNDYITQRQKSLIRLKKGLLEKNAFLQEVEEYAREFYDLGEEQLRQLLVEFDQYVFGYSVLSPLIDDKEISDIRVLGYDNVRVKRFGKRMDGGVCFSSEQEYKQFIDYIATRNQVSISNLNAIARFTDTESHPDFILRFTLSMPIINTYQEAYLCIRKVPKNFPLMKDLIARNMLNLDQARLLTERFRRGSILICGGNSSGKTTLLNALKETLPDDKAVLIVQQAEELTTQFHPDMMFLHSLSASAESQVAYDLKDISIAGLTMDVDYFLIGEIKGGEALYLVNAACTGQICAGTIHSTSARRAIDKLVDYAMYESRYSRNELMRMLDCFETIVFMKDYQVREIYCCKGWDEERKELMYDKLY